MLLRSGCAILQRDVIRDIERPLVSKLVHVGATELRMSILRPLAALRGQGYHRQELKPQQGDSTMERTKQDRLIVGP